MVRKIITILVIFCLCSCKEQDICNYKGLQVVEKSYAPIGFYFLLRKKGEITNRIYVTKYDYAKYNVGDKIICK